jgi:molybdate transport system permease protein
LSIAIYEHVETLNYDAAHMLALGLLCFSFLSLWLVYRYAGHRFEVVRG